MRRTPATLALVTLVTLAVLGLRPEVGAGEDGTGGPRWVVLRSERFEVHHAPGGAKDAERVRGWLEAGIRALTAEFTTHPVPELLAVRCRVILHPEPTAAVSEARAGIETASDAAGYQATIRMLTPGAWRPAYRSQLGEAPSEDHFRKLLLHEYSAILLDRITARKPLGWRFFHAPPWFVQGFEEYLGLVLTTERNRTEVLDRALAAQRQAPERIGFDLGVEVTDPYLDGLALVCFLHERFGRARVHALLDSDAPRFGRALARTLEIDLAGLEREWRAWRAERVGPG